MCACVCVCAFLKRYFSLKASTKTHISPTSQGENCCHAVTNEDTGECSSFYPLYHAPLSITQIISK